MPYGKNTSTNVTYGISSGYQSDCLPCTMGYYCLNATIKPYPCGKGKYSETGQSACQPCLAGRYCDLDATGVDEMNANKSCPAGKYCRGSLKDVGEAINCSKAHYCPEGKYTLYLCCIISTTSRGFSVFTTTFSRVAAAVDKCR